MGMDKLREARKVNWNPGVTLKKKKEKRKEKSDPLIFLAFSYFSVTF